MNLNINKKYLTVIGIVALLLLMFFIFKLFSEVANISSSKLNNANTQLSEQNEFELVELKTQSDFQLVGKPIFLGTGYEPGFNFVMNLAGSKFGTKLVSKYGEANYVGYLDLINQSTTTKIFSGKMLDMANQKVNAMFTIYVSECALPSGEKAPLSVSIKVSDETLSGCATMVQ